MRRRSEHNTCEEQENTWLQLRFFFIVCKSSVEKDYQEVVAVAEGEGEDDGEEY